MSADEAPQKKELSPEAKRALDEAKARRDARESKDAEQEKEYEEGGPKGDEPTRFGDWERKGIAYDF
ncbi:MAG: DUF1674 domain-containing protein [Pseudomonadota bacterium]